MRHLRLQDDDDDVALKTVFNASCSVTIVRLNVQNVPSINAFAI